MFWPVAADNLYQPYGNLMKNDRAGVSWEEKLAHFDNLLSYLHGASSNKGWRL